MITFSWNTAAWLVLSTTVLTCCSSNSVILSEDNGLTFNEEAQRQKSVTKAVCDREKPMCQPTGGFCYIDDESNFQCSCSVYYKEYDEWGGCQDPDAACEEKKPNCRWTGGSCDLDSKNEFQCHCGNMFSEKYLVYKEDKGCQVKDEVCDRHYPFCRGTRGHCVVGDENEILCNCRMNTGYGERGCEVNDLACKHIKPYCLETRGTCKTNITDDIYCDCPMNSEYQVDQGCKVSDEDCESLRPRCLRTGGSCKVDYEMTVQCECPQIFIYKQFKGCKVDPCKKKCGNNPGVACFRETNYTPPGYWIVGNVTFEETVVCGCIFVDHVFHEDGKFCMDRCGRKPCQNGGTCLNYKSTFKCSCRDLFTGDRCEISKSDGKNILIWSLVSIMAVLSVINGFLVISRCRRNIVNQRSTC